MAGNWRASQETEEIGAWLKAVWEGQAAAAGPWKDRVVELLRQMAVLGAEAPDYAQGKALSGQGPAQPGGGPFSAAGAAGGLSGR